MRGLWNLDKSLTMTVLLTLASLSAIAAADSGTSSLVSTSIDAGGSGRLTAGDIRTTVRNQGSVFSGISHVRITIALGTALVFDKVYDDNALRVTLVPSTTASTPYVVAELFSGGAHCCTSFLFIDVSGDLPLAREVDFGNYPPERPRPIGPNREYQYVTIDGTAYDFGAFAGSTGPMHVIAFRNGSILDVSNEHPTMLRDDERKHLRSYFTNASSGVTDEADLVSALADAYRLNSQEQVWAQIQQSYLGDFSAFREKATAWLSQHGYFK